MVCWRTLEKHFSETYFCHVLFIPLCSAGRMSRRRTIKNMLSVVRGVVGDPLVEIYLSLFPTETRPLMFSFQLLERFMFDFHLVYLTGDFPQISQRSYESVPQLLLFIFVLLRN